MICPYCRKVKLVRGANTNIIHLAHNHGWSMDYQNDIATCKCCGERLHGNVGGLPDIHLVLIKHLETCEPFLHLRCVSEITGGVPDEVKA